MFEGLKKLNKEMEASRKAMREKLQKQGQKELKGAFKELFEKHPKLKGIRWEQYTPYFNDGEECVFRIHDWRIQVDDLKSDYDESEYGDEYFGTYEIIADSVSKSLINDIESLFRALDDDCMEMTFGDHVQVTATPKGFDVEEYQHD